MPRHIPAGREDLWRRQSEVDSEVDRAEKAADAAEKRRDDLVRGLGWDDPLVDEADEEMAQRLDERNRAVAVADRIYQERTAGLSSWIDHDPTAPICSACNGAGCGACRGWGREYREPIPVWDERYREWVNPATGRTVDLFAEPYTAKPGGRLTGKPREGKDWAHREPYRSPEREGSGWTPAPLTMSDAELNAAAREWVSDCTWQEDPEDLDDLTDAEVRRGVNRHYEGGWSQFVQDANGYDPPGAAAAQKAEREAERAEKRPDLEELRRGRWYDENPIRGNASTGGGAVASIEEVRAGIMRAIEKMNEGLGAIQQGRADQEEAQAQLLAATEGSGQADVTEANGMLAQAVSTLAEASQQVSAATSASQDVANRL